jgi:hypothetical protein
MKKFLVIEGNESQGATSFVRFDDSISVINYLETTYSADWVRLLPEKIFEIAIQESCFFGSDWVRIFTFDN